MKHTAYFLLGTLTILSFIFGSGCGKKDNPVEPKHAPVIDSTVVSIDGLSLDLNQLDSIPANLEVTFMCYASDLDGDPLLYTWKANDGYLDRIDTNSVHWTAPDTATMTTVSITVSDGSNAAADTINLGVILAFALFSGSVTPGTGTAADLYTYSVVYSDPSGCLPVEAEIFIDGISHQLTKDTGSIEHGAVYRFQTNLSPGSHQYYFLFTDSGNSTIQYPDNSYLAGPHVTPDENTIINENTIVIDDQVGLDLIDMSDSTCTFTVTGLPPRLTPGDIIVGTEDQGYLRKVTRVDTQGDQITVHTTDAMLTDVIFQCNIDTVIALTTDEKNNRSLQIPIDLGPKTIAGMDIECTGQAIVDYGYEIYLSIVYGHVEEFYIKVVGVATLEAEVSATKSLSFKSKPLEITIYKKNSFAYLQAAHIPLIWYLEFSLIAGCEFGGEITVNARLPFEGYGYAAIGGHWYNESWTPIWDYTVSGTVFYPQFAADASVYAKAYVKPKVFAKLYGIIGPYAELVPYAKFRLDYAYHPPDPVTCDWGIYAGIDGKFGLEGINLDPNVPDPQVNIYEFEGDEKTIMTRPCFSPAVISTHPPNGATAVPVNTVISATFSEDMNPATLDASTFLISNDVTGSISYQDKTVTFTPDQSLEYNTTYTATITGDVRNAFGVALGEDYTWSFTTTPDATLWTLSFTADSSRTTEYNCSYSNQCATICPSNGPPYSELWFLWWGDTINFPQLEIDQTGENISHHSTGWYGSFRTFDFNNANIDLTGTCVNDNYNFQLVLTADGTFAPDPYVFEQPGPLMAVFHVTNAIMDNGIITGNFELHGEIHTPDGNCISLDFEEVHSGSVRVTSMEPLMKNLNTIKRVVYSISRGDR